MWNPSWESEIRSVCQGVPHLLWNPKVNYSVHKRPPIGPILNHTNPAHAIKHCLLKIHFNITSPSTPRSPKWSLPFSVSNKCLTHVNYVCSVILLDLITYLITLQPPRRRMKSPRTHQTTDFMGPEPVCTHEHSAGNEPRLSRHFTVQPYPTSKQTANWREYSHWPGQRFCFLSHKHVIVTCEIFLTLIGNYCQTVFGLFWTYCHCALNSA
jgi:hypothetical protein